MALHLENDTLQLLINPDVGASWEGLRVRRRGEWLPLLPEPGVDGCDLPASSFLMAPYCNRIAGGRFTFDGVEHQLADAAKHAIHGDVRKRPFEVRDLGPQSTDLVFESTRHTAVNWPWPFDLRVRYSLEGMSVTTRLELTNRGTTTMPAGFGLHPYFRRALTHPGEPLLVQFHSEGVYPDAFETRVPSGPAEYGWTADYCRPRQPHPDELLDFCTAGYDGKGSIHWPVSGVKVDFHASPLFGHLVFFSPLKPWFAMEPVTNANDGVNLLSSGDETSGVVELPAGDTLAGEITLTVGLGPV